MKHNNIKKVKEEVNMAVMAKPCKRVPVIAAPSTKRFIEESNKKRMTKEQLKKCRDTSKLFRRNF